MLVKHYLFIGLLVLVLGCRKSEERSKLDKDITYEVYGDSILGFGYRIFVSGKPFIDQPEIPAIGRIQKFKTSIQAKAVAQLVALKISRSMGPPAISVEELDSLKIDYQKF